MNIPQVLPPDHNLALMITQWFQDHGDLKPGESITVSLHRSFSPLNVVLTESVDSQAAKIRDAAKELRLGSIWYMVDSWGDSSKVVECLQSYDLGRILKYRNTGKVSLNRFAAALKKRGIHAPWMDELPNFKYK